MEISFIRHGRSTHTDKNRMTCQAFAEWVKKYDDNGVFTERAYPAQTLDKIAASNLVITSNLKRSHDSAKILISQAATLDTAFKAERAHMISDSVFRETELPVPLTTFPGIKLNAVVWATLLRALWFCGYARRCESLSSAKKRAEKAARRLVEYAQEHQSAALVGHGLFNVMIARELQRMGWIGKRKTSVKHWRCTTYIR